MDSKRLWISLVLMLGLIGCGRDAFIKMHDPVINVPDDGQHQVVNNPQFRMLIVIETGETGSMTAKQQGILTSVKLKEYAKQHCVKNAKGTPEFRIIDQNEKNIQSLSKPMQDAFNLPRQSVPWLYCTNGKTGFSGPCPDGADAVIEKVDPYAKGLK